MSESESESEAVSDIPVVPSPGELFSRKRREKKWTKEHVAKTLLLSVQHVEALENDEYNKLPGTTYVVGYWRSYANLLKIDISESIEFHKNNLAISPAVIALEGGHHRAHNHKETARKRSGLIFLVLSAIFLSGIWYWQNTSDTPLDQWLDDRTKTNVNNDDNQPAIGEITPIAVMEPEDYSNILSNLNFADPLTNAEVENNIESNKNLSLNSSANNNQADSQDVAPKQQQKQEFETTQPVLTQSTEAASNIENTTDNATENVSEPADENSVADSSHWIFLSMEKDSWLDVRDVVGDKLIYRIAKVGESISLKGHPPFYIFIGTAGGVRVKYLGKAISFKAEDDSTFARFRVGRVETKNVEKKQTNDR